MDRKDKLHNFAASSRFSPLNGIPSTSDKKQILCLLRGIFPGQESRCMLPDQIRTAWSIGISIRAHKGNWGGEEGNPGRTRGRQRMAGLSAAWKRVSARPFAACPEIRVGRSRWRSGSGKRRPDGRLAGIRMVSLRRWALLPGAGIGARRSARFERILGLAAVAFAMAQDAVDHPRVCNKGDDPHAGATRADQRFGFENLP